MHDGTEKELQALKQLIEALEDMEPEDQQRLLSTAAVYFGLHIKVMDPRDA